MDTSQAKAGRALHERDSLVTSGTIQGLKRVLSVIVTHANQKPVSITDTFLKREKNKALFHRRIIPS